MRILIYLPPNGRAVDQQSVMALLVNMGHEVYLLTQLPEGDLHKNAARLGVKTFSANITNTSGISSYLKSIRYVRRFVKIHNIDVVFAHLQSAGVIAGVARKLTSFRFFYVRHNTDEHRLQNNKKGIVLNWLANKLSARIIAPSEKVYRYIIEEEKVERSKVVRINYGYDFLQYLETDRSGIAESIRKQFPCRLLVISVARFLPVKRHLLMFEVIRRLVKKKMDIKMICLGDGPNADEMKEFVHTSNMDESIFLLGSKKNVFDYLEAADVFFHLSLSEASNSAVKEAGYCKKPAIVCTNVGDFDDYIKNGINGFIVEKENPVDAAEGILAQLYSDPERLRLLGQNIYQTIVEEFDIRNVKSKYEQILG